METIDKVLEAILRSFDRAFARVFGWRPTLLTVLALALGYNVARGAGIAMVVAMLLSTFFPREQRLGIIGAGLGLLFGWTGLAIGLALGLVNGWVLDLGKNDPPFKVAKKLGWIDGILVGGLFCLGTGADSALTTVALILFGVAGGFIGELALGLAQFIRHIEAPHHEGDSGAR